MALSATAHIHSPSVALVDGSNRTVSAILHLPFTIGRAADSNLVVAHPLVSRQHARIDQEGSQFVLRDTGSRHGTFVNGERIRRCILQPKDRLNFGSLDGPELRFSDGNGHDSTQRNLLSQIQDLSIGKSDLEKLRWLLETARELNNAGKTERVLASLLQATLRLAQVERGYVLLAGDTGTLVPALGMDAAGNLLGNAPALSQTAIRQAAAGHDQFIVTSTLPAEAGLFPDSMLLNNIRTIICIPLLRQRSSGDQPLPRRLIGMLYLDSHFHPERFTEIDHELLRTIAREAAALLDIAELAEGEEKARQHDAELVLAAAIQQGLMAIQIPALDFARVEAHSLPCSAVGGDFFDVLSGADTLSVALVDVSGKGVAAAILASILQGMIHVQLEGGLPLETIAAATNNYLCTRSIGKYATVLLLRLHRDGALEYLNCGHVQPRVCSADRVHRLEVTNLPVGLFPETQFLAGEARLERGGSVTLASDGFTEAENAVGDSFGDDRFDGVSRCAELARMIEHLKSFCADHPAADDCTVVQVTYRG